jgi:Tol biopolymer transport system component/tRNA A-37 threonylcarbamoyl transferase component Bud32
MSGVVERLNAALEGRYRIERELGQGGMATVYLAEDVKHDRQVALKVLKPELAAVVGGDRFLSEIKTTANMQDPHILPLYDSGAADGFLFYVMPYVEGDSLRDRLDREHQLPVDQAVSIAKKVASALQYAHEQGVVHRDIKPANILLRRGEPLVADFGIALALSEAGDGRLTETGLSMGTPHYMSPEQASGERSLDPRTDVYALACVLYEMLTGSPPHAGPTAQAVLAKILTESPRRASELRGAVPANVDAALARALEKLPADRMASPKAFVEALEDPGYRYGDTAERRTAAGAGVAAVGGGGGAWKAAALVLALVTVGLAGWLGFGGGEAPEPPLVFRAPLLLPEGQELLTAQLGSSLALSPDGTRLVYTGASTIAPWQFMVRPANALGSSAIPGTDASWSPVFAPDGERVAFINPSSQLTIMDIERGSTRVLADSAVTVLDWATDGNIYFFQGVTLGDTWRVHESGGEPEPVPVVSGRPGPVAPWGPGTVLPDGRGIVITKYPPGNAGVGAGTIVAVDFESETETPLVQGTDPRYLDGFLLWGSSDGNLMAAPFDLETRSLTGPSIAAVPGVLLDAGDVMHYSTSRTGSLVYRTGGSAGGSGGLVWVDREGGIESASALEVGLTIGLWDAIALSPDGSRVALSIADGVTSHIWIQALDRPAPPSRVTFSGSLNVRPRWTPDGESLTFVTNMGGPGRSTELWLKSAGGAGTPRLLVRADRELEEGALAPDGDWVVYRLGGTTTNRDIFAMRPGIDSAGIPLVATDANERAMAISPDGRWLAYVSDDTGRDEVFVSPFPNVDDGRWQVSSGGGHSPVWGNTGRELFFIGASSNLVAATYAASGGAFVITGLDPLFNTTGLLTGPNHSVYDVTPDDQRFLMLSLGTSRGDLVWVHNWIAELRAITGRDQR